jgi:hypothetical protein
MARKSNSRRNAKGLFNMKRRARAAAGEERSGRSNGRQQRRAGRATGKNGCSPKLFMLALPIIAVGMYALLIS